MMIVRLCLRLVSALILGSIITLYVLQYNERFKAYLQHECITAYEELFNCSMHAQLTGLQLLSPKIILEDITVTDKHNPGWSWHCKQAVGTISWINLLLHYPIIPFDVHMAHVTIYTERVNNALAIEPHILGMFGAPLDSPLELHTLTMRKAHLTIEDKDAHMVISVPFSCQTGSFNNQLKTTCKISEASLEYNHTFLCSGVQASLQATTFTGGAQPKTKAFLQAECKLLHTHNDTLLCYIDGTWDEGEGTASLVSHDKQLNVHHSMVVTEQNTTPRYTSCTRATIPVELLQHYSPYLDTGHLTGTAQVAVYYDTHGTQHDTYGTISCTDKERYGTLATHFKQTDTAFEGIVTTQDRLTGGFSGSWTFNPTTQTCSAFLSNDKPITLWPSKYWTIKPHECTITAENDDATIRLNIESRERHLLTDAILTTTAHIAVTPETCTIQAHHAEHAINAQCTLVPDVRLTTLTITDSAQIPLFSFGTAVPMQQYTGTLMFPLLKKICNAFSENSVSGTGNCQLQADVHDGIINGTLECRDASIRVMSMYNILKTVQATCALDTKKPSLVIKNGLIGLHKGKLFTQQTTILCDSTTLTPTFVHAPILIDNLLLSAQKEAFMVVSGSLLVLKNPAIPLTLRGSLILERGQIKKNIFANTLTKNVVSSIAHSYGSSAQSCALDIHIQAHKPLHVKTPFLEAYIKPDIEIKGTVEHPLISGMISIVDGSLGFPYKPLQITHATLCFIPEHLYDPRIELVAKGKIKKYNVTMRVSGSLEQPTITFESTPKLAEEKIITLILAGSEEGSFPLVMPTLIMHNIQQLLFGPEPTESTLERTFKNILAPLKGISIVPSFDDQSGRGGLRGAIEIGVNERLSGKIQKNFSLSEDTKFEVEYLLSDDMSIRATKDERGDLGGELEMRWKF